MRAVIELTLKTHRIFHLCLEKPEKKNGKFHEEYKSTGKCDQKTSRLFGLNPV